MKTIHKYVLDVTGYQTVKVPGLHSVVSVIEQRRDVVLYVMKDLEETKETEIEIRILGTGHHIDKLESTWTNLGTVSTLNGGLVWHVFYCLKEQLK